MLNAFMMVPVIRQIDHAREVIIERYASDYVSSGGLWEYDGNGVLHGVAYCSESHTPA
jgi:hypothetical protein